MRITWDVSDGYVGSSPHHIEIPDEEIIECETVEDAMSFIEECVQEDFSSRITWFIPKEEQLQEKVEELLKQGKENE